jgi:hypothetical protein
MHPGPLVQCRLGEMVDMRDSDRALRAMPTDLSELYKPLLEADDRNDAVMLARLAWSLFSMADAAQQAYSQAVSLLDELRGAAGATSAGEGSQASLALLRHVLAKHGWLPPPDATPLQVLAAPR